jgi:predicted RNA binding protein YcfA (HicA-like mRNA interferase family)
MPRRKRVTGQELIRALRKAGFAVVRIQGSHRPGAPGRSDGRVTTVPMHAGETIGPGLLGQILRDCDLTHDQLEALL